MEDFKQLSVEGLRKLVRKLLGKGHSRLRTRAQLLEALAKVSPATPAPARARAKSSSRAAVTPRTAPAAAPRRAGKGKSRVRKASTVPDAVRPKSPATGNGVPAAKSKAARTPAPPPSTVRRRSIPASAPRSARSSSGTPPAPILSPAIVPAPRAPGTPSSVVPAAIRGDRSPRPPERRANRPSTPPPGSGTPSSPPRGASIPSPSAPAGGSPLPPAEAEAPLNSAFFDGLEAPRRRPRPTVPVPAATEPPAVPPPVANVGTEAPVLLVRDPTTLFVFWDFRRELERGAALGLAEPRLLLRLFHGERVERSLELPLGTRSHYVEALRPGEAYAAEVALLGRDGWTRPMGRRSGPRRLPPDGPSELLEVRTLRVPWSEPLDRAGQPSDAVEVSAEEPLDSPRRLPLPTSPGNRGGGRGPSGAPRSGRN